ncbi:L-threonine 3-dehydrogenase-like [Tachypleus tridentatus]|uniref:L-threonine 3-dehydrogenase-like n=1 Tax=Tachypleus tridentatus TaxID=6853 RepID=UPI003FD3E100
MSVTGNRVVFLGAHKNPSFLVESFQIPKEEDLREGEILLKVRLATICGSDLTTLEGRRTTPVPSILGHEAVGEVVCSRRTTNNLSAGDRVSFTISDSCSRCHRCRDGFPQKCERLMKYGHVPLNNGAGLNGCYSTHMVLGQGTHVFKVPDNLSDVVCAPANCALATMFHAVQSIPLKPAVYRDSVAVIQGAGLLGLYGCALLHETGYSRVYCQDVNMERLRLVPKFSGIPSDIYGTFYESPIDNHPKAGTADVVLEVCGDSGSFSKGLSLLRPGGAYILVGMVHPDTPLNVTGEKIIRGCFTVKGVHNYSPNHLEDAINFLARTVDKFPYHELVGPQFSLQNFHQAIAVARTRRFYRIAINPTLDVHK